MNKKIAIGIGVVVVIALVAMFAMNSKNKTEVKDQTSSTKTETTVAQSQTTQTNLKELLGISNPQTCTFTIGEGLGTSTAYIAEGKMRSDSSVKAGETTVSSHMILDGKTTYTWIDGQKTGYKMDFSAMQGNPTKGDVSNTGQANIDPNKNFDFACSPWSVDQNKFSLPSDVEFTDTTKMMQDLTKSPANPAGTNTKDLCASLQEPAKSQCEAAFKAK